MPTLKRGPARLARPLCPCHGAPSLRGRRTLGAQILCPPHPPGWWPSAADHPASPPRSSSVSLSPLRSVSPRALKPLPGACSCWNDLLRTRGPVIARTHSPSAWRSQGRGGVGRPAASAAGPVTFQGLLFWLQVCLAFLPPAVAAPMTLGPPRCSGSPALPAPGHPRQPRARAVVVPGHGAPAGHQGLTACEWGRSPGRAGHTCRSSSPRWAWAPRLARPWPHLWL